LGRWSSLGAKDLGTFGGGEIFDCLVRSRVAEVGEMAYLVDLDGRCALDAEYLALLVAENQRGAVAEHLVALEALHDDAVRSHGAVTLVE